MNSYKFTADQNKDTCKLGNRKPRCRWKNWFLESGYMADISCLY